MSDQKQSGRTLELTSAKHELLREALIEAGGNKTAAARLLGVNVSTVYNWLRRFGPVMEID